MKKGSTTMRLARIAGTGHFVPEKVVTNNDLAAVMDTSDEWIVERTGIRERRFAEAGVSGTDLAVEASRQALIESGWEASDVQFIIFATLSPDMYFSANSAYPASVRWMSEISVLDSSTRFRRPMPTSEWACTIASW